MTGAKNGLELLLRYGGLAVTGPFRRGGALPDLTRERRVQPDPEWLAAYSRVCGFDLTDALPVTFPHVLAFGDTLRLLAAPEFPYPAIGLVHTENRIEQLRPIARDEPLTLRSRFGPLTEHHRGQQFDVLVDGLVDGAVVWRSASRYLHLARDRRSATAGRVAAPRPEHGAVRPTARWWIPADVGRRYAAVSADPNPIHLHPLGALLTGQRRPIAHGMWLLARCVAALADRLPSAYRVEVAFRRPVRLPGRVGFAAWPMRDRRGDRAGGWDFQLRDLSAGTVRLVGGIRPADR